MMSCQEGDNIIENPDVHGCLDSQACNYDSSATIDNNSCIYEIDCNGICGGDNSICMDCDDLYDLELSSFYLQDLNTTSSTYNQFIRPQDFDGRIRLFYFTSNENCELASTFLDVPINTASVRLFLLM